MEGEVLEGGRFFEESENMGQRERRGKNGVSDCERGKGL